MNFRATRYRGRMSLGDLTVIKGSKTPTTSGGSGWANTFANVITAAATSYAAVQSARANPGMTNGQVYAGYNGALGYDPYSMQYGYGQQTPSWLLPVGLGVGAVALAFILKRK